MSKEKTILNLKECGLFNTPESFPALENWIALHTPAEAVHLYTVQWQTINLICKLAKKGLLTIEGLQIEKPETV